MTAIAIRYLMGWSMATNTADRERAEWPPHPDRVFMALAAAYYETDGDDRERAALLWLERQEPPGIFASDSAARDAPTVYVPVNDATTPSVGAGRTPSPKQLKAGMTLLPEHRSRQPRHFPASVPNDPQVYLLWPEDPPPEVRAGLESLCGKVIRIGHSASLVQAWVVDDHPEPNWIPTEGVAQHMLRTPGPGRSDHLKTQYSNGRRPERSRWVGYARPRGVTESATPGSVFHDQLLTLRHVAGGRMGLESALMLASNLRNAVIRGCPDPVPEWVSGHVADGGPSQEPHIAFLPLPFVGREHADGHLMGLALALPGHVGPTEQRRCLGPVLGFDEDGSPRRVRLYDGARLEWTLEMEGRDSPPTSLRSATWTRPARRWSTVTPIVFDRHPKGRDKEAQTERMVADACERIGLPRPTDVVLSQVSLHVGVPHSSGFPAIRRKTGESRARHLHAVVTFGEPIRGPVILGAGRYRGYGFCRPVRWEGDELP